MASTYYYPEDLLFAATGYFFSTYKGSLGR